MALFKKVPNTTTSYCITVKNVKWFELTFDHISIGLLFRQTSAVIDQHKEVFGECKVGGPQRSHCQPVCLHGCRHQSSTHFRHPELSSCMVIRACC
jgi:hypothetical protein